MHSFLIAGLLIVAAQPALGQTSLPEKWSGTVSVVISSRSTQLQDEVTSYINRELRSLGDITVSDSHPTYVVEVVAAPMSSPDNQPMGVVLSAVIKKPLERWYLDMWLKDKVTQETADNLAKFYTANGIEELLHHVTFGAPSDVPALCRDIVTAFDTRILLPARKEYNDFMEQQKQLKRQGKGELH